MKDTLYQLKEYRRQFVDMLAHDITRELVRDIAALQIAIQAVEAVAKEPKPEPSGPRVEFGEDGWPIDPK